MKRRFLLAIFVIAFAVTLAAYSAVLNLPFAGDDLDHLKTIGNIRSGQVGSLRALMTRFNEQTIPILRLFYLAATYLSGLDGAITLRMMLALVHSAGAVFCGLIVHRYTRSRIAMLVATVAFAGSAGFSGSVISAPACAIFLLGLSFITAAVYLLTASPLRGWTRFVWCLLAFAIAGLAMNATPVFAVTLVILIISSRDDPSMRRWLMASIIAAVGVGILGFAKWNLGDAVPPLKLDWNIVSKFAWMGYTAPLRFLSAWFPGLQREMTRLVADDNTMLGHLLASGSLLIWLGSWRLLDRCQRKLLLALFTGTLALNLLIAVGRARDSYLEIYTTNRYYHFFLLPFAIQTGFVANSLVRLFASTTSQKWRIITGSLAVGLAGFAIFSSALNAWQWVHHPNYVLHGQAISAGKALVRLIEKEARTANPPKRITLLDGEIPFPGIHKNTIALRTLWFAEYPHGIKNVVFQQGGLSDQDIAVQNALLDRWARIQRRDAPPVRVSRDRFVRELPWRIDFRNGGFDNAIVSGFHAWNSGSRWLAATGIVRLKRGSGDLILTGNVPKQVLTALGRDTIGVGIGLNDVELGRAEFTGSQEDRFQFPIPDELKRSIENLEEVTVTLKSDVIWIPRKLKIGLDERELSVLVMAVGFETSSDPPQAGNP